MCTLFDAKITLIYVLFFLFGIHFNVKRGLSCLPMIAYVSRGFAFDEDRCGGSGFVGSEVSRYLGERAIRFIS